MLFVCMGNICRSPTAEGVFRQLVEDKNLAHVIRTDSAGTHDYHIGESPDTRAQAAAVARGVNLSQLRGRQVGRDDFLKFDYILAMDHDNLAHLRGMNDSQSSAKLGLLLDYAPGYEGQAVPDPYFGRDNGFALVLDLVEIACAELLQRIIRDHLGGTSAT